jgi:uncharacterized glyoxalase superfamily protein PhnB
MIRRTLLIAVLLIFAFMGGCRRITTEPLKPGAIQGAVRCLLLTGTVVVPSAQVFWGDSLLATTDSLGNYRIDGLEAGNYELTCSALNCKDSTQQVQVQSGRTTTLNFDLVPDSSPLTPGAVQGTVRCLLKSGAVVVPSAYVFWGDSLLATTDVQGNYLIDGLTAGDYLLTCSALYCGDTTTAVSVQNGRTMTLDFNLLPDSSTGRIYGEFQDDFLFQQRLLEDTTLSGWTEKEIYDGGTGATLQTKTLEYFVPDRTVSLGDSILAYSDGWGQYFFRMPVGTYSLTGACEGYKSVTRVVRVEADVKTYLNFFLPREE